MSSARYFCPILNKFRVSRQIFKQHSPKLNLMKIRPVGAVLIRADRQGPSDMAKLMVAFRLKNCISSTYPWQCYVPLRSCRFIAYLPIQLQNWSLTAVHISITITPAQKRVGRPSHRMHQPRLLHFGGARFIPDNHNYIYTNRGEQISDAMSAWQLEFVWWRLKLCGSSPWKLLRNTFLAATFVWKKLCNVQFIYNTIKVLLIILSFGPTCLVWWK
jgi:hypothetical protein